MFTQNSGQNKCLENFKLKPQRWRVTVFCLRKPRWWLQLWPSSFNVPLVWFLNLFGVKAQIWNLPKVQQVTIRKFLWKRAEMESADFFVNQTLVNRAAVDTYTFHSMLFQFCVTTATLINFTQNSDLNKSV